MKFEAYTILLNSFNKKNYKQNEFSKQFYQKNMKRYEK